jgi:radical SAM family uncharacterized protein
LIQIDGLLSRVTKPGRYIGGELNSVRKDWDSATARVALIYPDVYEVGMSNLGLQILYDLVNRDPDLLAERAYAPWVDMEALMRERGTPLFSLESRRALSEFDLLGFSLSLELIHTNALNLLDLAGLPVIAADRDERHPIVMAGGSCAYNPEPVAPFCDLFVVGDGEEVLLELMRLHVGMKRDGRVSAATGRVSREAFLREAARLDGVYVPSFYRPDYESQNGKPVPVVDGAPAVVQARRVMSLESSPLKPVVPFMEAVHDRAMVEVQRGCTRGCRFCQAGVIYRPVRERTAEDVLRDASELANCTGYDELSLMSLSTADYSGVEQVVKALAAQYPERRIKVSLPSLRVDAFSVQLAHALKDAYAGGLTFAPEAGTQRLRDVINKGVTQEDIEAAVEAAFAQGWTSVKLYFMLGLPTETEEDLEGIARLAYRVRDIGRRHAGGRTKVKVSVGCLIPKPHAPFQWIGQEPYESVRGKMSRLKGMVRGPGLSVGWHEPESSVLESALARGDRRTAAVIHRAWRMGCRFDAWAEHFQFGAWREAFALEGMDIHAAAERQFSLEEPLPWDHISTGVTKEFLVREYRRALEATLSPDCRVGKCLACGVRQSYGGC